MLLYISMDFFNSLVSFKWTAQGTSYFSVLSILCFLLFGQHHENVVMKVCILQLYEHQCVIPVFLNKSHCWTECLMHCKNFLNNCSGICLQFCTFSCSYTEAVTLRTGFSSRQWQWELSLFTSSFLLGWFEFIGTLCNRYFLITVFLEYPV